MRRLVHHHYGAIIPSEIGRAATGVVDVQIT